MAFPSAYKTSLTKKTDRRLNMKKQVPRDSLQEISTTTGEMNGSSRLCLNKVT